MAGTDIRQLLEGVSEDDDDTNTALLDKLTRGFNKSGGKGTAILLLPSSGTYVDKRSSVLGGAPREVTMDDLWRQEARSPDADAKIATRGSATSGESSISDSVKQALQLLLRLQTGRTLDSTSDSND